MSGQKKQGSTVGLPFSWTRPHTASAFLCWRSDTAHSAKSGGAGLPKVSARLFHPPQTRNRLCVCCSSHRAAAADTAACTEQKQGRKHIIKHIGRSQSLLGGPFAPAAAAMALEGGLGESRRH